MEGQVPAPQETTIIYPVFAAQNSGLFMNLGEHSGQLIYVPRNPMPWNPTQKHVFVQPPALYHMPMPRHQARPIVWQPAASPQMIVGRPMTLISRHNQEPLPAQAASHQDLNMVHGMYFDIPRKQLHPVKPELNRNVHTPNVVYNTRQVMPGQVPNSYVQNSNQLPLNPGQDLNRAQEMHSDSLRKQPNPVKALHPHVAYNTRQVTPGQALNNFKQNNNLQPTQTSMNKPVPYADSQDNSRIRHPHNQYIQQYNAGRNLSTPPGPHGQPSVKSRVQTKKTVKINENINIPPTAAIITQVPSMKSIQSEINDRIKAEPNAVDSFQSTAHATPNTNATLQVVDSTTPIQTSGDDVRDKREENVDVNTLQAGVVTAEQTVKVTETEQPNLLTVSTAVNDTTLSKEQMTNSVPVEANETKPKEQCNVDRVNSPQAASDAIMTSGSKDAIDVNTTETHIDDSGTNVESNITDTLLDSDEAEKKTESIPIPGNNTTNFKSECVNNKTKICDISSSDNVSVPKDNRRKSATPNLMKYRSQHGNLFFDDDIPDDYILTHVIEGFVLQESKKPFPVKRLPLRERLPINEAPTVSLKRSSHTSKVGATRKGKSAPKKGRSTEDRSAPSRLACVKEELNNEALVVDVKVEHLADEGDREVAERSDTESSHDYSGYPFASYDAKTVQSWSVRDLAVHVSRMGWHQAATVLMEQGMDGKALFMATVEDLTEVGLEMEQAAAICSYTSAHLCDIDEYGDNDIVRHIICL